jgi:PAS domain-containing protein
MDMEKIGQAGRSTSNSIDMRRKRKEAEEALKASETSYRRLFESAQDGILLLDADTGQITDIVNY